MASHKKSDVKNSHHDLDRIMANYAFMDEGLAEWETKKVLYALRKLAVYDTDMPKRLLETSKKTKMEALAAIMDGIPQLISLKYLHGISRITRLDRIYKSRTYIITEWQRRIL
jgi:hypothetical protein